MHNLIRCWSLCSNCVTLEQVARLSCQKATLQRGTSQAVIVDTLLSAHKLLANLTSPISIFFFFSWCKLYPGGDKSATRPHKAAPSVFRFPRQEHQMCSCCYCQSSKLLRRMENESCRPINNHISNVRSSLHIFSCGRCGEDKECQGDMCMLLEGE